MHEYSPKSAVILKDMAILVPFAHAGHWLWVLYLPPILIVAGSILRAKLLDRRSAGSEESSNGKGSDEND